MDGLIKFGAQYLILAIALVLAYTFYKVPKKLQIQFVAAIVLAVIVAGILDKIAGNLYYDPRPFVSHNVTPLIAHTADNGFPSEHTLAAMTLSTVIYFYRRKFGAVAFAVTLIIGICRVAAHVHSPIDILGGLVIGGLAGAAGYHGVKEYAKKHQITPKT